MHNLESRVSETIYNDHTLRNKKPHDTSTYLSVNCKLLQSPQWSKGLLTATHSLLCSPHAPQVSNETLMWRFCVPTTEFQAYILSSQHLCFRTVFMDRKVVCKSISRQLLQGLAMGKPQQAAALLQPATQETLPTRTTTWIIRVRQTRTPPHGESATSERQADSFNSRGNSGQ